MTEKTTNDTITQIAQKEFGTMPVSAARMPNGICNDVYTVDIGGRDFIFRLNSEPRFMLGSHKHIPLFRSKGIIVPEILAEDYSRTAVPFAYQVQNRLPGRDIGDVIETLSDHELRAAGAEIANIFRQLASVPNNGKFGVLWGDDRDLVDSWSAEVARVTKAVTVWGRTTGVLDAKLEQILKYLNSEYKGYFERVRPLTYFGDLSAKNVMISEGTFSGLVDLDSLAQGDPLEAVGRIKAIWYGTRHGTIYSEAVIKSLMLTVEQQKIVTMYALLNRAFLTLENGVQFNQTTGRTVDRHREALDKKTVADLLDELRRMTPTAAIGFAEIPPASLKNNEPAVSPVHDLSPERAAPAQQFIPKEITIQSPPKPSLTFAQTDSSVMTPKPPGDPYSSEPEIDPAPIFTELVSESDDLQKAAVRPSLPQKIMLEASGLSKTYTSDGVGFNALKNVDLRIHKGDCIAIVGKSGSGKSTLMHLLACLDIPSEGYVYVDGDETSTMSETEKNRLRNEKFGFVFQQFFLNGRETVFENVVLPMRIRGASDFDMITDANEALASVGLTEKSDKKAKDLSGGEKQRVCIARALVGKPQVIFADEPTGNLDSNTGAAVENMLFELNREKGITLVIVTHDADLSNRCERIVELKDGQIVAEYRTEADAG